MDITDPTVISFERTRLSDAIKNSDTLNGDLLLAYSRGSGGRLRPDALILKVDPYGENDDVFLEFEGHSYVWDMDFFTLRDVKLSVTTQIEDYSDDDLELALQHYIENDAFIDFSRQPRL